MIMAIFNYFTASRLEQKKEVELNSFLKLSLLIPARNEAHNLPSLLSAVLQSQPPPHEIIVLDDNSADDTFKVATEILKASSIPFQILRGAAWSPNLRVTGKNYACSQLARAATGNVFLFCDADVIPSSSAVGKTLQILTHFNCAGVSALPAQITTGLRERLTLPWIMQLPLTTLLPLGLGWRTRFKSLQMANGQWLAVHRSRYEEVGGHQALGLNVVEDLWLARLLADKHRGGLIPALSANDISVKMYSSWDETREGFAKNIIQIYGGSRWFFSLGVFVWIGLFSFPLWGLTINPLAAILGGGLILTIRLINGALFRNSNRDLLSHFQSLFWLSQLCVNAIRVHGTAKTQWKGRNVSF
jgi:chlorobactene glucosyltransferase